MNDFLKMPVAYCLVGIVFAALFESVRADWGGLAVLGAMIFLYALLAKGDKDESRFQTGDNCYFIGFVYTLSIITLSLILDAEALLNGLGERSLIPLLKTIGIALGTSVVGMLCRFWLTYDIRIGEDAFDKAVRDAAVAVASLRGVVGSAAKAAAPLEGVVNDLRQTVDNASAAIEDRLHASSTSLNRLFDKYRDHLEAAFAETNTSLQTFAMDAAENFRQHGYSLTQETKNVLQELQNTVHAHAKAVEASLDRITSPINDYTEAVNVSVRQVGKNLDEASRQAVAQVANGVAEALQANTLADVRQELDTLVRAHQEAVSGVSQTLAKAMDSLTTATTNAVARADEAGNALAAIDGIDPRQELVAVTEAIIRFREEMVASTEQISTLGNKHLAAITQLQDCSRQLANLQDSIGRRDLLQGAGDDPNAPPQRKPSWRFGWTFWRR